MSTDTIFWLALFLLAGAVFTYLLIFRLAINSQREDDLIRANNLLHGVIRHEIRSFINAMSSSNHDERIYSIPLKHACNTISIYIRLGGTFEELSNLTETVRSILDSKHKNIPVVMFSGPKDNVIIEWLFKEKRKMYFVAIPKLNKIYSFNPLQNDSLKLVENKDDKAV